MMRGAALIESVVIIPLLSLISLGAIEGYFILSTYMTLTEVVKEGLLTAAVIQQQNISSDRLNPDRDVDLILKLVEGKIDRSLFSEEEWRRAQKLVKEGHGGYSQCFSGTLNATTGRLCGMAIVLGRTRELLTSSTLWIRNGVTDSVISIWRDPTTRQVTLQISTPYKSLTGIFSFVKLKVVATGAQGG